MLGIEQPNPEEPSYCLDHAVECVSFLGPYWAEAMTSADFPWLNVFLIVALTIAYS